MSSRLTCIYCLFKMALQPADYRASELERGETYRCARLPRWRQPLVLPSLSVLEHKLRWFECSSTVCLFVQQFVLKTKFTTFTSLYLHRRLVRLLVVDPGSVVYMYKYIRVKFICVAQCELYNRDKSIRNFIIACLKENRVIVRVRKDFSALTLLKSGGPFKVGTTL